MVDMVRTAAMTAVVVASTVVASRAAEIPDRISANGDSVVLRVHAEGAQIYECKADPSGQLVWEFREPIASLFRDDTTVGRHYAGPTWEIGGSIVSAKVVAEKRGATDKDVAWLRLDVTEHHGSGPLQDVTTVQRINTSGGNLAGKCGNAGMLHAEPYSADYVFLRKS